MKSDCEVIRDLLPLYVDDICSGKSRELVDEHLAECSECSKMLNQLKCTEIEAGLKHEKQDVISYGKEQFKKLSARTGITASGLFMIPIAALLAINLIAGSPMGWFLIVLAALVVAASVIAVPILVPEDKLFWTFCGFTVSLELLLGVICLVSRGNWFWLVSSCVLFGLAVFFLPFVIRARPLQKWIGNSRKVLLVLGADALLFLNMMNTIRLYRQGGGGFWVTAAITAAVTLAVLYYLKTKGGKK